MKLRPVRPTLMKPSESSAEGDAPAASAAGAGAPASSWDSHRGVDVVGTYYSNSRGVLTYNLQVAMPFAFHVPFAGPSEGSDATLHAKTFKLEERRKACIPLYLKRKDNHIMHFMRV